MRRMVFIVIFSLISIVYAGNLFSHCEIPCGIYDDRARISLISEHIITIEKSMNMIVALSGESDKNYNQIVRWVNNKEKHATDLMHIVTQYFMAQRIKLTASEDAAEYKQYQDKLTVLHQMLVYAMKAKQGVELANADKLNSLLDQFNSMYFGLEKE